MVSPLLANHPLLSKTDLERLGAGKTYSFIESQVTSGETALPLYLRDGRLIGCIASGQKDDSSLAADILLENLACKATAVMAFRTLLSDNGVESTSINYIINSQ